MDEFLDDVYSIKKLKLLYQDFIDVYNNKLTKVKQIYKEQSFVNNGLALPILHKLGWNFFNIASDDVVLPRQILPEWEGDKAALVMTELREILLEAVYKYLEKFD
jgi:DNA-binding transcriptional regulator PaaX